MQERVHKQSVRKTDRQIQATPLHPWFKVLFQQGNEPNCASCIWSPPLGQELCTAGAQPTQVSMCLSFWPSLPGMGQTWKPSLCALQHTWIWHFIAPLPEQKLCWEQWPDYRTVGRSCLSSLLSDLAATCIAPPVGWCKHSLRAWLECPPGIWELRVQTCSSSSKKPCVLKPEPCWGRVRITKARTEFPPSCYQGFTAERDLLSLFITWVR